MKMPTLDATISRRLLVNYRLDPEVARSLLPSGLRPGWWATRRWAESA